MSNGAGRSMPMYAVGQIAADVARLKRIIDGEGTEDAPGLRRRVADLEKVAEELKQLKFALRAAIWLLGLLGGGNLLALLLQLLRHAP